MFNGFYQGKRVLVTGHTGFKGAWLSLWLSHLGAKVFGYSLKPPTTPNLHEILGAETFSEQTEGDVRDIKSLSETLRQTKPDLVIHMAAQPLVRLSYSEPLATLQTNAIGTANVLEAIRQQELGCNVIVVTTDKCYENREWEYAYREIDPLGGHDVYSASKAAAEIIAHAWSRSFFAPSSKLGRVATARAGNVIGGGDYAQDRILPDCIRALMEGRAILVRNPHAVRPWQHVLECLSGYLWLAARLEALPKDPSGTTAFNFGPEPAARQPVRALVEETLKVWPGQWMDGSDPKALHEARLLALSIEKAAAHLQWQPVWTFTDAVQHSVRWYQERHSRNNADMLGFSRRQIDAYVDAARAKGLAWTK